MPRNARRWLIAGSSTLLLIAAGLYLASFPAEAYVARQIRQTYGDKVQIGDLKVRLLPSIRISARNVVVPQKQNDGLPPLISIGQVSAQTNWIAALGRHVRQVRLQGLRIAVPPRRGGGLQKESRQPEEFVADRIIADGAVLQIFPKQTGKPPLDFDLYRLTIRGAGPDQPMSFETTMRNAKPPGDIHSTGKFGPWQFEDPAQTPVSGSYEFRDANLGVFKGISGTLSSVGSYDGVLDRIAVDGSTDTPDFALRISGHPVHLTTKFQATVNGTDGNTYLHPVTGHFGGSTVIARGAITRDGAAKARTVSLDATVDDGRLEDMLRLALKSQNVMTGAVSFTSKIVIPPGDTDVAEKLRLDGSFTVAQAHFSKLNVQEKVNDLSHRGRGDPQRPDDDNVASNFRGQFRLDRGEMTFRSLHFDVPGVHVALNGTYGLLDQQLDLHGTATLQAKLSQTTTGWKSVLLKAVDPFFKKKNAGAVLPIHISGTSTSPHFGLGTL